MSDDNKKHTDSQKRSQMQGSGGDDDFDLSGNPQSGMQTSGGTTLGSSLQEALPSNTSTENQANPEADVPVHKRQTLEIWHFDDNSQDVTRQGYEVGGYCPIKAADIVNSDYKMIKALGQGTYSTVWMAWDSTERKHQALKIAKSADQFQRVAIREIKILELCALYDQTTVGANRILQLQKHFNHSSPNGNHVVMVFKVHGPSFHNIVHHSNQGLIHLELVKRVTLQLMEAVSYLHDKCGLIHSDIKPSNIMVAVTEEDIKGMDPSSPGYDKSTSSFNLDFNDPKSNINIILCDFGLSCSVRKPCCPLLQTCAFRAPEVFLKSNASTSADMWSVGCVVFELVTGEFLFPCDHAKTEIDEAQNHLNQMIQVIGQIPYAAYHTQNNATFMSNFFKPGGTFNTFKRFDPERLLEKIRDSREMALDHAKQWVNFISILLKMIPWERGTAKQVLEHPFLLTTAGIPHGSGSEDLSGSPSLDRPVNVEK